MPRSSAIRSTSSTTTTDGCSVRATEHAWAIQRSEVPDTMTTVVCGSCPSRYRMVCVLPVPGAPCSSTPRLRCWPLALRRPACRAMPRTCRSMPGQDGGRQDHAGPVHLRALLELQQHALAPPPAEDLAAEGDDLPAEHVVPDDLVRDPVQHPLGRFLLRGAGLQGDPFDAGCACPVRTAGPRPGHRTALMR